MGSRIPVIASAEDIAQAARQAERDPSIQWYVARRAVALRATAELPESWQPLVAAYGGEWTGKAREKAVSKGQAYGEGSFPIRDKADLKRAIQAFGRAKDKAKAKSHIIRRARALGAVSMLPDSWNIGQTASAAPGEITEDVLTDKLTEAFTASIENDDFDVDVMRQEILRTQMGTMK